MERREVSSRSNTLIRGLASALARSRITPNQISAFSAVIALLVPVGLLCVGGWPGIVVALLGIQLRLLANGLGAALHGFTPFDVRQAALLSLAIVIGGFVGGLVLSAVKRSLNAKDWGSSIPGHGGVLDRLDSIAFSAPIFFHLTRYWFTP